MKSNAFVLVKIKEEPDGHDCWEKLNIQLFIIYMTVKENLLENLPLLHHAIIGRYKYGIIWKR